MRLSLIIATLACLLAYSTTSCQAQMLEPVLIGYYACLNNVSTENYDNSFYNTTLLQGYTTFSSAMGLFKNIFSSLANCPTTPSDYCRCMETPLMIFGPMKFGAFFLNEEYFADMVQILSDLKTGYTLLSTDVIYPAEAINPFSANYPSLVDFVIKYDFTAMITKYYQKTLDAMAMIQAQQTACFQPYLNTNTQNMNNITTSVFKADNLKQYTQCLSREIGTLDKPVRRTLVYLLLASYPEIIVGDMLDFIDSLFTAPLDNPRRTVWVIGDPHISSLNKGYQICNFLGQKLCLKTAYFEIWCKTEKVVADKSATLMTDVTVNFTNGALSLSYEATSATFNEQLSMTVLGITVSTNKMPDATGNIWLEIMSPKTTSRTILDYKSNTTLTLTRSTVTNRVVYSLMLRTRIRSLSGSEGILAVGCDPADKDPSSPNRRKRETPTACANVASSTTSDETMPASTVQSVCNYDVTTSGDDSFAKLATDAVESVNSLRNSDSVFPTSAANKLSTSLMLLSCLLAAVLFTLQ